MKWEKTLNLESECIKLETEAHFMKKHLLPKEEQIDSKVMIAREENEKAEFNISEIDNQVNISAGGISIKMYKYDFMKEICRFLTRQAQKELKE